MLNKIILFFVLQLLLSSVFAKNIAENMDNFIRSGGVGVNITQATAFQGQAAGGYTLGSMSLRNPSRSYTPIMMQAPSIRMGCGGIDMFTGSFSYINSNEMVKAFRNIGSSMGTYAVMMALESACPMCKKQVDQLQRIANEVNRFNINSCETAAGIVGGLWPRTETAQRHVCTTASGPGGIFSDFAAARQKCGSAGENQRVFDQIKQASQKKSNGQPLSEREKKLAAFEDMLLDKGNISWMILIKSGFLKEHGQSMAEMLMSLSGSLIYDGNSEANIWRILPSKASDEVFLSTLLYGELNGSHNSGNMATLNATIYQCDTTELYGCLNPKLATFDVRQSSSWVGKIHQELIKIQEKARSDEPLSPSEVELISSARFPLFRAINVQSAYSFARDVVNLTDYAEFLALDILDEYLSDLLDIIMVESSRIQIDAQTMRDFHSGLSEAKEMIRYFRSKNQKKISNAHDMVQRIQFLEQQLVGEFDADLLRTIDYTSGRR